MIGHPIAQVKSPEIFNNRFQQQKIDSVMVPLDIEPAGLQGFIECYRHSQNIHGCLVTIPYKEDVTKYIDLQGPQVAATGVANVLRRTKKGKIEGDMTDGRGFLNALEERAVSIRHKHLFIIGCGGAGSAVAWDTLRAGARKVSLLDSNHSKAVGLKEKLSENIIAERIETVEEPPLNFDIVMNATPLGMRDSDPLPMPIDRIPKNAVVTDAVTSPAITPFLQHAQSRGHIIQTGSEMAAGQAQLIADYFGINW
jgi:shikimate dehydrogenase